MIDRLSKKDLTGEEVEFLKRAEAFFNNPSLFVTGMNWFAKPINYAEHRLPERARQRITLASQLAITRGLEYSIKTLPQSIPKQSFLKSNENSKRASLIHKGVVTTAGGLSGFFGLAALPIELPFVTISLLRLIAEIARQYGNDPSSIETQLDCNYVLSMGNQSSIEGYYASRIAFTELQSKAISFIASCTTKEILAAIENKTAPALIRLIGEIASQFEIRLARKILSQAIPVSGALAGGTLNFLFANYYGEYARYHFGLKRIEREHGLNS